jgi:hypothetical protein
MSVIRASAKALNATALSARLLSKLSLATGHGPRFDLRDLTGALDGFVKRHAPVK